MPNEHEQFFMSINKMTSESYKFIDDFVKCSYYADTLSTFLALVRSNQLKIESVTDIEFVFLQVPDYEFRVKHFERDSKNSGWLIDSFSKISPEEKEHYLSKLK